MLGIRIVLQQVEQYKTVDVGKAKVERDAALGRSLRAMLKASAAPALETTPLKAGFVRSASSRIVAKVGSSSTMSTKGCPCPVRRGSSATLEVGWKCARHNGTAIVVACRRADGRRAAFGNAASSGIYSVKVDPSPAFDRTCSSPPRRPLLISRLIERRARCRHILRLVVPSACWNASKISFCLSSGMPMPVSMTEISIARSALRSTGCVGLQPLSAQRTPSVTLPLAVNLNAFDKRLRTIC